MIYYSLIVPNKEIRKVLGAPGGFKGISIYIYKQITKDSEMQKLMNAKSLPHRVFHHWSDDQSSPCQHFFLLPWDPAALAHPSAQSPAPSLPPAEIGAVDSEIGR